MSHYYVPDVPVTLEDDADWIKKISRKFKKAEIVEKLNTIGASEFNPKSSKKILAETLLYSLREQIDEQVDEVAEEEDGEDGGDDDDDDDEPYEPIDDPSYRSELDGDLEDENLQNDEEEEEEEEDDDTFVARMQKRFGLTTSKSKYFISGWNDPTFLFCIGTLMSVVFVRGDSEAQTLNLVPFDEIGKQLREQFIDPAFVAGSIFLFIAYSMTSDSVQNRFSQSQRMEAGWYLWNGAIIHVMMDGMAGAALFTNGANGTKPAKGGWGLKLMNENYQILDKRFSRDAELGDIALATVVTQTELFVHSVLCLYAYVGICTRKKWADAIALIALSFQLFGAIVFIVPDLLIGCPNMQPFELKSCVPGTTLFELFYFWFGVVVNIVWVIVPLIIMKNIIQRQ